MRNLDRLKSAKRNPLLGVFEKQLSPFSKDVVDHDPKTFSHCLSHNPHHHLLVIFILSHRVVSSKYYREWEVARHIFVKKMSNNIPQACAKRSFQTKKNE